MDKLPHSLLLQILSRLDDSADVARCRVASKAFNSVFPGLRSITLRCSHEWYYRASNSTSSCSDQRIKPLKTVFMDLISKLETVESVCVDLETLPYFPEGDFSSLTDGDVAEEWLPRVSGSLKSLSIHNFCSDRKSNVLPLLISAHCYNLVNLKLKYVRLSVHNMNPMPMLTSLTLAYTKLEDENANELNRCFPNLQVLNLKCVKGLKDPKIHLLHLQTCHWAADRYVPSSLTLITPSLVTLTIECFHVPSLHVEAPVLSRFHLSIRLLLMISATLFLKEFENLKTLWLNSDSIGSFLSQFPITTTVEDLTLHSEHSATRVTRDSEFTLAKVFAVFPNVTSLRINSLAWLDLEACLNPQGWEILDGRKGLKKIHANLMLVDPSLTLSFVARVLDQCVGLSEVSLLIHDYVDDIVSEGFMSKCMARWPGLKWRWGTWREGMEDSWITNSVSN